jgi:predicted unusual protein kinase regulating ubiquinone biosynthesis (AarF/ABC1/UbiB family)
LTDSPHSHVNQSPTHTQEADSLLKVGVPLERALPFIAVPKPYLATRRLLVMSFLDGVSISRLEESEAQRRAGSKRRLATRILTLGLAGRGPKEGEQPPALGVIGEGLKKRLGLDLIRKMADAWGWMMFNGEAIHCDNHPGACVRASSGSWGLGVVFTPGSSTS